MGYRLLTWRALRVYVPLDLFFRVSVWIGYRAMVGPLEPEATSSLGLLALAVTLPFIGAWISGLIVILAPIDRWLALNDGVRRPRPDRKDLHPDLLRRARRAAIRAPRHFAMLSTTSWVVPFGLLNYLVLEAHSDLFGLTRTTWVGVAFMGAALPLGAVSVSITFMSWFLGPTMGRLSLAAHAEGLGRDGGGSSLHWRTLMIGLCLGLTPVLWFASVALMWNVRDVADRDRLRSQIAEAQATGRVAPHSDPAALGAAADPPDDWLARLASSQIGITVFFCVSISFYAVLCAGFLAGSIGRPVASIARVVRDITEQGHITNLQRIPVFQRDEIGDLVDGANWMLDRLEEAARASRNAEASLRRANEELEKRVLERTSQLANSNSQLEASVAELCSMQRELMKASRLGGMAEVASVVLHNIGNLLTSVNVSAEMVSDLARESCASKLADLASLLEQHRDHLAEFLVANERGRVIPTYLVALAGEIGDERAAIQAEIGRLRSNLEHIKIVIGAQQSLARGGMVTVERVDPSILVEEALKLSLLDGGEVEVTRDLEAMPPVSLDRHLVMQILTNLLRNAQEAVAGIPGARIGLRVWSRPEDRFAIEVSDNGAGIPTENLSRIFSHGFSTKADGNGFGLHSSACSARLMRGSLTASSAGPGQGATFTLELPTTQPANARAAEEHSAA